MEKKGMELLVNCAVCVVCQRGGRRKSVTFLPFSGSQRASQEHFLLQVKKLVLGHGDGRRGYKVHSKGEQPFHNPPFWNLNAFLRGRPRIQHTWDAIQSQAPACASQAEHALLMSSLDSHREHPRLLFMLAPGQSSLDIRFFCRSPWSSTADNY